MELIIHDSDGVQVGVVSADLDYDLSVSDERERDIVGAINAARGMRTVTTDTGNSEQDEDQILGETFDKPSQKEVFSRIKGLIESRTDCTVTIEE